MNWMSDDPDSSRPQSSLRYGSCLLFSGRMTTSICPLHGIDIHSQIPTFSRWEAMLHQPPLHFKLEHLILHRQQRKRHGSWREHGFTDRRRSQHRVSDWLSKLSQSVSLGLRRHAAAIITINRRVFSSSSTLTRSLSGQARKSGRIALSPFHLAAGIRPLATGVLSSTSTAAMVMAVVGVVDLCGFEA